MKNKIPTVAILTGETHTEYFNDLIKGFYACAQKEEINLVFLMRSSLPKYSGNSWSDILGNDYQAQFSNIFHYVPLIKPDVLIIAYGSLCIFADTPSKAELLDFYNPIPCMILEDESGRDDVPYLIADNYAGMKECIQHLIKDHGYQNIGFLGGPKNNRDSNERLQAYLDTMAEYNLPVTDTMVAHGNYSEMVEDEVNYLLDNNIDLEAIAFANDNMAKTGYRVCENRGLLVGYDFAITGFDDVDIAKTMTPPLTSVSHSSFLFSYQALQNALNIYHGEPTPFKVMPSYFRKRNSCGCVSEIAIPSVTSTTKEEIVTFTHNSVLKITTDYFSSIPYETEKKHYENLLFFFFDHVVAAIYDSISESELLDQITPCLKQLCAHPHISIQLMMEHIINLLQKLTAFSTTEQARSMLLQLISSVQQYVFSHEILKQQADFKKSQRRNWFVTSFTQDLLSTYQPLEESLLIIMKRLKSMQIRSCYFFLHHGLLNHKELSSLQLPETLFLASYYNENEMQCFSQENWKPVTQQQGILDFLPDDKVKFFSTHVLFSGEEQYGLLLCESEPGDNSFLLSCSLQIGSFLHFYRLNTTEHQIKNELKNSIRLIQEQNNILNFISSYDELTKLLNRRGFMEKTLHAINNNIGKEAYLLFADLDHLKEINDRFGHAAGDFALQTISDYLKNCLPEHAIIARIGGDEFVSFIVTDQPDFQEQVAYAIRNYTDAFNRICNKPYYIEMSIGIYKCQCDSLTSVSELLQHSDELLYKEKLHRRSSVLKAN